jgi:uncharacterized membrane protein YkvI
MVIGGGYATARESAEFFLPSGPWGGPLGVGAGGITLNSVRTRNLKVSRIGSEVRLPARASSLSPGIAEGAS